MSKDMLKEFFFDALGFTGREYSRMLGRASSEMLYILAEEYAKAELDLILESAYFVEFARPHFMDLVAAYPNLRVVEIYCSTDKAVRRERFQTRNESGARHQGHIDGTDLSLLKPEDPEPLDTYAPLEVGQLIQVDTTAFGDQDYQALLTRMQAIKEEHNA
jgi:hypothetical protein